MTAILVVLAGVFLSMSVGSIILGSGKSQCEKQNVGYECQVRFEWIPSVKQN